MFFKDIPGNQRLKKELVSTVKKNRISHAQVFSGNSGSAKLALAFAYARYINCTSTSAEDSCGQCTSCLKYNTLSHPDLHLIFPVVKTGLVKNTISDNFVKNFREFILKNIYGSLNDWIEKFELKNKKSEIASIYKDEALSIQRKLTLKKFEARYRVFLIWMPEQMNIEASNKLLKVFEEPPSNTIFLLVSENPEKLLPTISSRTQQIRVKNFKNEDIFKFFQKRDLTIQKIEQIINMTDSDLGKMIKLIEGFEDINLLDDFSLWMRLVYKIDVVNISKWVDSIYTKGRKHQNIFLSYSINIIRECLIFNFADNTLLKSNTKEKSFISKFSPFINENNSVIIIEKMENAIREINRNANAKILFFELSLQIINLLKVKRNFAIN